MLGRKELNNDDIGYVEQYDFSMANRTYKDRVNAVSKVASICYNSTIKPGSDRLFKMLGTESKGLPSSSYEVVPILLTKHQFIFIKSQTPPVVLIASVEKYGEWIEDDQYLLTNLRALIADVGEQSDEFYNTSEEDIAIIKKHFKVFKAKIDLSTRSQLVRHRNASYQELSRRYVSGEKLKLEFYMSPKLQEVYPFRRDDFKALELSDIYEQQVQYYNQAIDQGVKPEEARRLLPQALYTVLWSAWLPESFNGMLELRMHKTAQTEIIELAIAMKELSND